MEKRDVILLAILAVSLASLCLAAYAAATDDGEDAAMADQIRAVAEKGGIIEALPAHFEISKSNGYEIVEVGKHHVTIKSGSTAFYLPFDSIDFVTVYKAFA